MPGKHAPDSPRSYYVSLARALGAALGAVALMVVAVVILLSRGGDDTRQAGSPAISPGATASRSPSPRATRTPTASPTASPTTSPTSSTLAPSDVTVRVENGTSRSRLAARTADRVRAEGYEVTGTGNTARTARSTIFYRAGARDEALEFQDSFPEFTVLRQATGSQSALLRVVVGADYP